MLNEKSGFKSLFQERFQAKYAKTLDEGTLYEKYMTLADIVKMEISNNWIDSRKKQLRNKVKEVYYFSIEFLPGRLLLNNLNNLGLMEIVKESLDELGIDLLELADQEEDPGLGNGGLGRLAAAYLDGMATLGFAGHGCGIRYRYGLFEQSIVNGYQIEEPDNWLNTEYAWEYRRDDESVWVRYGGFVEVQKTPDGQVFSHEGYEEVRAIPYDIPIVGYGNNIVNKLRLWNAEPLHSDFDYWSFSRGDYNKACEKQALAESISHVLYPDDSFIEGKRLRLKQSYFFVSAGLQSIISGFKRNKGRLNELPNKLAFHINDTHPSLVIPELMRILLDEERMGWDEAWDITTRTASYTNHTTLPEALEKWPVDMFRNLLPRIYMIVEEINRRYCLMLLDRYPEEEERIRELAIIADGMVKMGNLSIVGSYSVNGVARIHTEILQERIMENFYKLYPHKFNNKTNGITHRRWLMVANPPLAALITKTIGKGWITNPAELAKLDVFADDVSFKEKIAEIKFGNKERLSSLIHQKYGITVDPTSIFDVHAKRIHAYKRQLLNILHVMHLYNMLREDSSFDIHPRTYLFAGKAAPGYHLAKTIIKLINTVGNMINQDPLVKGRLKVVFLENYNVSLGEFLFPSADVSEQIATASKEASGTGNMKFIMNGAVTIGTVDGANVEIIEQVGSENFIDFGLSAREVLNYQWHGGYSSWDIYNQEPVVKNLCDQLVNGFIPGHDDVFRTIYDYLLQHNDEYFVLKDFNSYLQAQKRVEILYKDSSHWRKMCVKNIAHSGYFSSDRSIKEYAEDIWKIKPVAVRVIGQNRSTKEY